MAGRRAALALFALLAGAPLAALAPAGLVRASAGQAPDWPGAAATMADQPRSGGPADQAPILPPFFRLLQPASTTATPRIVLPTRTPDTTATVAATSLPGTELTASPPGSGGAAVPGRTGGSAGSGSGQPSGSPSNGSAGSGSETTGGGSGAALQPGALGLPGSAGSAEVATGMQAEADAMRRAHEAAMNGSSLPGRPGPRGLVEVPESAPEIVRQWSNAGPPWPAETSPLQKLVDGRPWPLNVWPSYLLLAAAVAAAFARLWRRMDRAAGVSSSSEM